MAFEDHSFLLITQEYLLSKVLKEGKSFIAKWQKLRILFHTIFSID